MKKTTIWLVAIVMGLSFLVLLFMQLKYIEAMVHMKKEQFDESVNKALYQASRNLELNETLRYLEKDVNDTERKAYAKDSTYGGNVGEGNAVGHSHQYAAAGKGGKSYSSFELKTMTFKPSSMPKAMILRSDKNTISEATKSMREIVKNRYIYQKALLDEVGRRFRRVVTVEDGCLRGGVGEAVTVFFTSHGYDVQVTRLGIGDAWVEHGTPAQLRALCGYDEEGILRALLSARFPGPSAERE